MPNRLSDGELAAIRFDAEAGVRIDWPRVSRLIADLLAARARIASLESALTILHDEMQIANTAGADIPHKSLWGLMQVARRLDFYREQAPQ